MPRIADSELERLKAEVSLVRLVEASGVKLEKRGRDHVGCCPFHDDKTPSLVVSAEKNLWNCLGTCGEGGDVIQWVMKAEGVSFRHAVELLKNDFEPETRDRPVKRATARKLPSLAADINDQKLMLQVMDFYHETLKASGEAVAYLEARGLDHPELIETFKLGVLSV